MTRCVARVRRAGASAPEFEGSDEPVIWFTSIASLAAVLSEDNRTLLRAISSRHPKSITELAALTGRKVSNLSRTLKMMAGCGLVKLNRNMKELEPIALATRFLVMLE